MVKKTKKIVSFFIGVGALISGLTFGYSSFGETTTTTVDCFSSDQLAGVNLAGAEFTPTKLPGRIYYNYTYPSNNQLDYYKNKGIKSIRLPVMWERLQPTAFGVLNSTNITQIKRIADYAKNNNMCLIIDLHNSGKYYTGALTSFEKPSAMLSDFWTKMGLTFTSNNVGFGLMDSPTEISSSDWKKISQETINTLRTNNIKNKLVVSGGGDSKASNWFNGESPNSTLFSDLNDPLNRTSLEITQFLDSDYSGTKSDSVTGTGIEKIMTDISFWAKENNKTLWLGAFGTTQDTKNLEVLKYQLNVLKSFSSVWSGWNLWAGGARWGNYSYSIEPSSGIDKAQLTLASQYFSTEIDCESMLKQQVGGVNLAGAEFNSSAKPGVLWKNFAYPNINEMNYFNNSGLKIIRLPVLWERVQPKAFGDLDTTNLNQITTLANYAKSNNMCLLIDIHNYGKYYGSGMVKYSDPAGMLADVWTKLGNKFNNSHVAFDLMNEPAGITRLEWSNIAQNTVNKLRESNINNVLVIPGGTWEGAHSWFSGSSSNPSNADLFANINDPLNKSLIGMHQYADSDYSGTHTGCITQEKMTTIMDKASIWAQNNNKKLFLGEFGVGNYTDCLNTLGAQVKAMKKYPNTWGGYSYWAGGPWWGSYFLSIEPVSGVDKPQMTVIKNYIN